MQTSANAMSIFSTVFARWQHYIRLCPIWQWYRILQSYPGSRCWSGSPPKSNHLKLGQV